MPVSLPNIARGAAVNIHRQQTLQELTGLAVARGMTVADLFAALGLPATCLRGRAE